MRFYSDKNIESYKRFEKLALINFFANLPNFIMILISAFSSNTVVVWVDTLVSFGETSHALIVWLVARKMRKETGDKYNFGMGRLEVFISFVCDLIVTVGMAGVLFGSVLSLQNLAEPSESILLFCILKCANSLYDVYFYVKYAKLCRENPTKLNETERLAYRDSTINDVAVAVIGFICFFFRTQSFVLYFSPIVSIVLAVWFIFGYIRHMRSSIGELSDVSLPLKTQDEIYDIVMEKRQGMKRIRSVNCRRLNGKAHVEISLIMQEATTYAEMEAYLAAVKTDIAAIEPNAEVSLVIEAHEE